MSQVEDIAKCNRTLKGLKIKNKHSKTLYNTNSTVGVDYADEDKVRNLDLKEDESDKEEEINLINSSYSSNNFT